ncbi:hypothetical protein L5515_018714 [Caenorhabditis briggsae]|uniref:Uncharacterized protein n=1 Tax=Caenorhabditis briggsae TaxID=6238 RepID=A0AAE9FK25_CAEBR|nr:hypothetical protein L5515_018714 [Caenorhabditis briggsae]
MDQRRFNIADLNSHSNFKHEDNPKAKSTRIIDSGRTEYVKPNRDKKKCDEYYPKHYDDTTEDIPLLTETLKKYHTSSWTLTQWTLTLHRFPVPVLWIFIREDSKKMCRFSNFSVPLLLGSCNEQRLQYSAFTPGFGCCPVPVNEAPRGMIKITSSSDPTHHRFAYVDQFYTEHNPTNNWQCVVIFNNNHPAPGMRD